ncbi:MAG: hypothetical protein KDK60_03700, partial [Chlamydiia bacterium]|nr:hypothetical protein [Chlamydiia bacterium]
KKLFKTFWKEHQWTFFDAFIFGNIAADPDLKPFLFHLTLRSREIEGPLLQALNLLRECDAPLPFFKTFRSYTELSAPLWGGHPFLRKQTLQGLAAGFYPRHGFGYSKSFAYGRSTPIGSLFKIVTGYEALKQKYHYHQNHDLPLYDLSPFEMIDEANPKIVTENGIVLGRYLDGSFITRHHKGGRMPQSHAPLGKVDFRMAMERSSNLYFSLLASEHINHPADLFKTTKALGFGSRTGIDLYGEIPGYVPDDIRDSKTGLYAFAIGQHSLVVTPLQTAGMLAAIGNGGKVYKPKLIKMEASPDGVKEHPPYLKTTIDMPPRVRSELLEGLKRVVTGEKGPVQPYRIRTLYEHPKWIPDYKALQSQFVGKTSTAEFVYRPTLDRETPPTICKDIWFGALAFKKGDNYKTDIPELAVVVYLRFGDYGKEAAPLAANIIKKWREIEESHYSEKE